VQLPRLPASIPTEQSSVHSTLQAGGKCYQLQMSNQKIMF